ncbi:pirin family protein [Spirosoma radiotolerans]|uniref:Pimeloyl-CoA dehydrogenase n=1 Tax=Spirosoma radiotolerans TaxID=1379870 RepID=A0A0E3V9B6_9BACT|nr:pirin-like C-terminal cupin domain-containing protein [Spirosoma radiotolerans]AKD57001.1 pimeloyl-CoA dehydrogenase [Spirosoma radiotolerans]
MIQRTVSSLYTPHDEQGFLGAGHVARSVLKGGFAKTDPFIFLMDDILDKKDNEPAGGPHPHAGFETVSLLIDGEIKEKLESIKKGDFQIMTAGSGTVHTETIDGPTKGRLFQMWLNLPRKDRSVAPRIQILPAEHVPVVDKDGVYMRLYSGTLAGIHSPVQNYTPLIAAEFDLKAGVDTSVQFPASFNAFLYVISGSMQIAGKDIKADQVAWLDLFDTEEDSRLTMQAGENGVRFVLYAAKPTHEAIVSYGPFIADTQAEIADLYKRYRSGLMKHIATAPEAQKLTY